MTMGLKQAARRLASEELSDLFFVAMLDSGKIFGGFECPHGPDMLTNVQMYFEKFRSEVSIAQAMADGDDTTGMGTVRDLVKMMVEKDSTHEVLTFKTGDEEIIMHVSIKSKNDEPIVDLDIVGKPMEYKMLGNVGPAGMVGEGIKNTDHLKSIELDDGPNELQEFIKKKIDEDTPELLNKLAVGDGKPVYQGATEGHYWCPDCGYRVNDDVCEHAKKRVWEIMLENEA